MKKEKYHYKSLRSALKSLMESKAFVKPENGKRVKLKNKLKEIDGKGELKNN